MRELITAQNIADARRAGQQSIVVAPNALITPQAKDDAKLYGIAIMFRDEAPVAPMAPVAQAATPSFGQAVHQYAPAPSYVQPSYAQPAHVQPVNAQPAYAQQRYAQPSYVQPLYAQGYRPLYAPEPLSQPLQQNRTLMNNNNPHNGVAPAWAAPVIQFGNNAQGFAQPQAAPAAPNAAEIAAQVAAHLQQLMGNNAALQSTVAQVVSEVMGGQPTAAAQAPVAGACGCAQGSGSIAGVDVIPFSTACPSGSVQGEVNIEEALLPGGDGPGVTRFSWANTALEWTFAHDEVLVVTKGTVLISQGGANVSVCAGGAVRLRKGTSVTLTAQGEACCLSSSWPA